MATIGIVGLGYVGLTTACCLAHNGHHIVGLDIVESRVTQLSDGRVPFFEAGIEELLRDGLDAGHLRFTTDATELADRDVIYLCLATPQGPEGKPDLDQFRDALSSIAPMLKTQTIVVTKSTVPPGTGAQLAEWTGREDLRFVSNPEFLREGSAVEDALDPDRIVIGATDADAAAAIESIAAHAGQRVINCDPLSAELIKYASNTFLATKLSFINEMARLCDVLGGDVAAVTEGMGADERIAASFMTPGPGWGGSCFPKDVAGLASLARTAQLDLPVIAGALRSNEAHLDHVYRRLTGALAESRNPVVAVWGLTFKANTDDTRYSPAIELVTRLQDDGITVRAHDPVAPTMPSIERFDPLEACSGADVLVIATEWPEYASIRLTEIASALKGSIVVDLRGVIDEDDAKDKGLTIHRVGRPAIS